jgi:hypothetical protein
MRRRENMRRLLHQTLIEAKSLQEKSSICFWKAFTRVGERFNVLTTIR